MLLTCYVIRVFRFHDDSSPTHVYVSLFLSFSSTSTFKAVIRYLRGCNNRRRNSLIIHASLRLYTVQCTVYKVCRTGMYTVHCTYTLYSVQCTKYLGRVCTLYIHACVRITCLRRGVQCISRILRNSNNLHG